MTTGAVELKVAGQTYRVASTAPPDDLRRLAQVVEKKLREMHPTSAYHPQSMFLVAIALAHEVEQERERRVAVERRSKEMLTEVLTRVDAALELATPEPEPPADGPHAAAP
jgi:cell division protein ZapA